MDGFAGGKMDNKISDGGKKKRVLAGDRGTDSGCDGRRAVSVLNEGVGRLCLEGLKTRFKRTEVLFNRIREGARAEEAEARAERDALLERCIRRMALLLVQYTGQKLAQAACGDDWGKRMINFREYCNEVFCEGCTYAGYTPGGLGHCISPDRQLPDESYCDYADFNPADERCPLHDEYEERYPQGSCSDDY